MGLREKDGFQVHLLARLFAAEEGGFVAANDNDNDEGAQGAGYNF